MLHGLGRDTPGRSFQQAGLRNPRISAGDPAVVGR
jgi:hypothetical protein